MNKHTNCHCKRNNCHHEHNRCHCKHNSCRCNSHPKKCVNWNTFCFQGCTWPASAVDAPGTENYDKAVKLQQSTFTLCNMKNAGHYINMGDQIYQDFSNRPDADVNPFYEINYLDLEKMYSIYADPNTNTVRPEYSDIAVIETTNDRYNLYFRKTEAFYESLHQNGIDNLVTNGEFQWDELMNGCSAKKLRRRIGSNNFLYVPDDHDWEINDVSDSLSPIKSQVYDFVDKYYHRGDLCNPQVKQMKERKNKGQDNPGFYHTVAYEMAPGKFVQVVCLDYRSQRVGTVVLLEKFFSGRYRLSSANSGENNYNPLSPVATDAGLARTFAHGDTVLGKDQLLWLQDVLQKNGTVPAYSKDGNSLHYNVLQDKIYFRCIVGATSIIAGSGFRDRLSTEEASVLYHIFNGGQIVDDPTGVVTVIDPLNYDDKKCVNGIIGLESGNHHFEGYVTNESTPLNQTANPALDGITPPYPIYSYHMGNWSSNGGTAGQVTRFSTNTLDSTFAFRYDNRFRRKFTSRDLINQPSAILINFDLSKDGFERAYVECYSWGNQALFVNRFQDEVVLENNPCTVNPYTLMSDMITYNDLKK